MVATPVIAVFVDVKAAIIITLLPTATVNIASVLGASNISATVSKYLPLMVASLVGAIAGSMLLAVSSPGPYRLVLAMLIVSFLVTSRFKLRFDIKPGPSMMLLFGCLAGLAGGTTNVMVAVLIIYFLSARVDRLEMVPAMNLCFLVGKVSQTVVFIVIGLVGFKALAYTIPLAVAAFLSLRVGQSYAERIDADRYRVILQVILLVLAAILIIQFFIN